MYSVVNVINMKHKLTLIAFLLCYGSCAPDKALENKEINELVQEVYKEEAPKFIAREKKILDPVNSFSYFVMETPATAKIARAARFEEMVVVATIKKGTNSSKWIIP